MMIADFSMYSSWGWFALRATVGAVFLVHGWAKVKQPAGIAGALGVPTFVGTLHGLIEVAVGLALLLGIYLQIAGLIISVIMLGAIYYKIVKWKMPFMSQNGTGWEFDLIILGAGLFLLLR